LPESETEKAEEEYSEAASMIRRRGEIFLPALFARAILVYFIIQGISTDVSSYRIVKQDKKQAEKEWSF
jgi:hypothetical protein